MTDDNWIDKLELEVNMADLGEEVDEFEADLANYIRDQGFKVIDKRPYDGCLWVVEQENIKSLLKQLRTVGYNFKRADSPRATGGKPGYWWKP